MSQLGDIFKVPPGDLQRQLQRDLLVLAILGSTLLVSWFAAVQYFGSYSGGYAWMDASARALTEQLEKQRADIVEQATLLSMLNAPRSGLQDGDAWVDDENWAVFEEQHPALHTSLAQWRETLQAAEQARVVTTRSAFLAESEPPRIWSVGAVQDQTGRWAFLLREFDREDLTFLASLSSMEVVLLSRNNQVLAHTLQDLQLRPNPPTVVPPGPIERPSYGQYQGTAPYRGAYGMEYNRGNVDFGIFQQTLPLLSPSQEPSATLWLVLPAEVMLLWPKRGLMGTLVFSLICVLTLLTRVRHRIRLHLSPVTQMVQQLRDIQKSERKQPSAPNEHLSDIQHLQSLLEAFLTQRAQQASLEEQLRQAQKMEAVGALAGGVAHDFNNLLSIIMMNLQHVEHIVEDSNELTSGTPEWHRLISDLTRTDGSVSESLHDISQACSQAEALTRRLLDLSRSRQIQEHTYDVVQRIQETLQLIQRSFPNNIQIITRLKTESIWTRGNANSLQQAILNLCLNARDAMAETPRRELTIRLFAHQQETEEQALTAGRLLPGRYVGIDITDTGIGISSENLTHLFEPFFTTKDTYGTGLGLAMVYRAIINNHGGAISVRSEENVGSTVTLYLPAIDPSQRATPSTDTSAEDAAIGEDHTPLSDVLPTHLVVVEDNDAVRSVLTASLRRHDVHVVSFGSAKDFLDWWDRCQQGSPEEQAMITALDVIVSDVLMPNMNGRDLWLAMRQRPNPPPFLFVTGYDHAVLDELPLSANQILHKPTSGRAILQRASALIT